MGFIMYLPLPFALILIAIACILHSKASPLLPTNNIHFQDNLEDEDESLEKNLERELGDYYVPFPLKNMRQIRLLDLKEFISKDKKNETLKYYEQIIKDKSVYFEDKDVVSKLEHELLERGIWGICEWVRELPPPFNADKQCTTSELKFLLDSI